MNKEQQEIHKWMESVGWSYWTPHEMLARITEEVGELARAINHEYGPKKRKATEEDQTITEELGDILFALACFANAHDIDLDAALAQSHNKVKNRDLSRFN
ncbi:MAG: nucleotide pyrophosphohydrolase [Candidatus Pacebacteria bacterium]|jgi:NTP pyrophosphatase (non-canonical NTP hydrolase)|nr:nucleotide pyrophosphohydrolase [Candidatus Paceibacterota bacterium]